ncbi:MAG: hypothetical protein KGS61_13350, partial [Verrucomicrobia bacterium]|nr:hypothetical protein [Verrucomicrobiota bacterium]
MPGESSAQRGKTRPAGVKNAVGQNQPETIMRKCNCSGTCGPRTDGLTRREFIGLVGAGTASML